jgi:DNA gyrase subunit A
MTLRELLQHFLDFREETLTRQYRHELQQAANRVHTLEGLLQALSNLDDIIDILRNAPDGSTAKVMMQQRFDFSDRQSDAILSMPLRRLTGLERQNLQTEFDEITSRMQELQLLLDNRREFLKALKKDLRNLKRKHTDARRTRLQMVARDVEAEIDSVEEVVEAEAVVLEFTQKGYIRRRSPKAFQKQQAEVQPSATPTENEDATTQTETATTDQELLVLTRSGKAYTIAISDIPVTNRNSKGTPLVSLLPTATQGSAPEPILAQFILAEEDPRDLIMLTRQGRIKRVPMPDFTNLTGRGLIAAKLKDDDELQYAIAALPGDQLVLASSGGRMLRFDMNDDQVPIQSRTAQGSQAMRMGKQEHLVGCVALRVGDPVLLLTDQGYGKQMPSTTLRLGNRGDLGLQAIKFALKTDVLAGIAPVQPGAIVTVFTDADRTAHIDPSQVVVQGKDGTGDRLVKLNKKEKVVALAIASLNSPTDPNPKSKA